MFLHITYFLKMC